MDTLGDVSLPSDVSNTALHLAASLVQLSPDLQGSSQYTVQLMEVVCGRDKWEEPDEVQLVVSFFQELASNKDFFIEVGCSTMAIVMSPPIELYSWLSSCTFTIVLSPLYFHPCTFTSILPPLSTSSPAACDTVRRH